MSSETAFQVKIILCVFWIKWNLGWIFYVHMLTFQDKTDFIWVLCKCWEIVTIFKLIHILRSYINARLKLIHFSQVLHLLWIGNLSSNCLNRFYKELCIWSFRSEVYCSTNNSFKQISKQSLFVKDTVYSTARIYKAEVT